MKILITGSCGFIGFNFSKFLLEKNFSIVGIDNLNNYYSVNLKKKRLNLLKKFNKFKFHKIDLNNYQKIEKIFKLYGFDYVFHFAAQAGVRYSIQFPKKYIDSNICGYFNILELSKKNKIRRLFYASSSSVYGDTKKFPLKENNFMNPNNTYSLSKKFNEDISKIYSKYYDLRLTGLRLFTIYGEWGRPDMFIQKTISASFFKKELYLNNHGNHYRDFTYIGDAVKLIYGLFKYKKLKKFDVFNICSNKPFKLNKIINLVEKNIRKVKIIKKNLQKADVIKTHGDNSKVKKILNYRKFYPIEKGLKNTIKWFEDFYRVNNR
jgi:UDP-glucuronate 4-epimerase